jgi:hypothetical protein
MMEFFSHGVGHRGTNPGRSVARKMDDRTIIVEDHTPFPHDLIFGSWYGLARQLSSLYGVHIKIERTGYDTDPETGDEVGIYKFSW